MKERILNYMAYIDQLLADDAGKNEEDYEKIMEEHKLQLTFFMHERLVHLLVTLTFALLAFATFFALVFAFQPGLVALFIAGSMMRCTSVHGRKVTRPKNDMICQAKGMR